MSEIRCDVKDCANRQGSICTARTITMSPNGFCLNNTIRKNVDGQCLTCGNCDFYMYGKSLMKPVCKMGYLMNFEENNECWVKRISE